MKELIVCFLQLPLLVLLWALIRNHLVYRFRGRIIDIIFSGTYEGLGERLTVFHKVSYDKMLWKLFTPLKYENYWSNRDIEILLNTSKKDNTKAA